jgi:hypothetical protein
MGQETRMLFHLENSEFSTKDTTSPLKYDTAIIDNEIVELVSKL